MAFQGELSSYPLPDLLQWLDSSRKTGTLVLRWDGGERKLNLKKGQVLATAAPGLWERLARAMEQGGMSPGKTVLVALTTHPGPPSRLGLSTEIEALVQELAGEEIVGSLADLTQMENGEFQWTEGIERTGAEWVSLSIPLRHFLFESLRWVDELPAIEKILKSETATLVGNAPGGTGPVLQRAVLYALRAHGAMNLGRLRLLLGLQRGVIFRAVHELLRTKKVHFEEPVDWQPEPIADMLEKGAVLLNERQFDAAIMVFSALLVTDPHDRRVREFLRMVEREYVADLYRDFPAHGVLELIVKEDGLTALKAEERQIAKMVNGRWDVSAIVLASSFRELDTLKTLVKLNRMGLIRMRPISALREAD